MGTQDKSLNIRILIWIIRILFVISILAVVRFVYIETGVFTTVLIVLIFMELFGRRQIEVSVKSIKKSINKKLNE